MTDISVKHSECFRPASTAWIFLAVCVLMCLSAACFGANVDDLIFEGADFHYKGDIDRAIVKFEAAVQLDPRNEFAHNQLGLLYAKKNRFDKAFHEFSTVAQIDANNTFALKWLGILELREGKTDNAFNRFNRIIQIDPGNADAYYLLGTLYNFRHNPAMAIEYLKKARDADSEEAATHFRLAKAFHNVDMIDNAMLEYRRALEINPGYTKALNEIGWIYYNQGNVDAAISCWTRTLSINPKDRDAVFNLAKAYNDLAWYAMKSGKTNEAIACWKKTLSVNPDNKAAKYYLEQNNIK